MCAALISSGELEKHCARKFKPVHLYKYKTKLEMHADMSNFSQYI